MKNDRVIAVGGMGFAVFTAIGIFMLLPGVAGGDTTNTEAVAWAGTSAHRIRAIAGAYLMCGGAMAMIVFLVGMCGRLRAAGAAPVLVEAARLTGVVFVVCQVVSAMAMAGVAYAVSSGNEPPPIDPGAARITTIGLAIWLIPGMISAAVLAGTTGIATLATKSFPTWVGLTALLLALVLLGAITFLPALLLLLWVFAVALAALFHRSSIPNLDSLTAPP